MLEIPGASPALARCLREGLAAVENRLDEVLAHDSVLIAQGSHHLKDAGGKRFRPLLTLLAAELSAGRNDAVVDAAVGVELTHLASLYHDDVMDEASLRRGVPSANAVYGNSMAILLGDLLFGKASEIIAHLGAEAVLIQAQTFVRLCAGQIEDERQAPAGADPMEHYLRVLADKTGVLIATAARYGGMFSAASADTVKALENYGELVGLVFQLADDCLDITSDAETSGKTPGTDLREGVATLPTLYVMQANDPADERLRHLLSGPITNEADHAWALQTMRNHEALQAAHEATRAYAQKAADLITGDSAAAAALRALPLSVAQRAD